MQYQFPRITHIDQVRAVIKDSPEFIVAERENYNVINYMVSMADTFPEVTDVNAAIRRECRGLVFDKQGYVIARRLHKFFNVNEKDETQLSKIDLDQPHVILEKLDGSKVTPIPIGDYLRWGTKMGITDVAMNAEEFVAAHAQYEEFAWLCVERGQTPIFEWCSRKNRIVVDYPEDRLVLIAVRYNETGEYVSYQQLLTYAEAYNLDVVKAYVGSVESMTRLVEETRAAEGAEGWVVRFDTGHMIKVKAEWYLRLHKTKENLNQEKNVIQMLVDETIDDAKAFMLEEDRKRVDKFQEDFWFGLTKTAMEITGQLIKFRSLTGGDRKRFALEHAPSLQPHVRSIIFANWDKQGNVSTSVSESLINTVRANLGSQPKVDGVRYLWKNAKWSYLDQVE